jgi:hypothetical protein
MTEDTAAREPLDPPISQVIRNSRAVVNARLRRMAAIARSPGSCDSTAIGQYPERPKANTPSDGFNVDWDEPEGPQDAAAAE